MSDVSKLLRFILRTVNMVTGLWLLLLFIKGSSKTAALRGRKAMVHKSASEKLIDSYVIKKSFINHLVQLKT
jgi:hypothetical protein